MKDQKFAQKLVQTLMVGSAAASSLLPVYPASATQAAQDVAANDSAPDDQTPSNGVVNQPKVVGNSVGTTVFNSGNTYPSTYVRWDGVTR